MGDFLHGSVSILHFSPKYGNILISVPNPGRLWPDSHFSHKSDSHFSHKCSVSFVCRLIFIIFYVYCAQNFIHFKAAQNFRTAMYASTDRNAFNKTFGSEGTPLYARLVYAIHLAKEQLKTELEVNQDFFYHAVIVVASVFVVSLYVFLNSVCGSSNLSTNKISTTLIYAGKFCSMLRFEPRTYGL